MVAASAASVALRCVGGRVFLRGENRMPGGDRAVEGGCWSPRLRRPSSSVPMRRCVARAALSSPAQQSAGAIAASTSACVDPFSGRLVIGREGKDGAGGAGREPVSPEKLDEWMRGSVAEIVRSIGEAPFLVHVFSSNEGPAGLRLEREAADAENWPHIRRRWATGAALPPDGVILVEELEEEEEEEEEEEKEEDGREGQATGSVGEDACCSGSDRPAASSSGGSSSKTWGLVVQGRGTDGAACYILNTCRVRSSFGFCTHFCLARAKCFGDTADVQLKKAWLLGRRHHGQHRQQQ